MKPLDRFIIRFYFGSEKILKHFVVLIRALFTGFWLGVMDKKTLDLVDRAYYSNVRGYQSEEYNRSGLWNWEKNMLTQFFDDCHSLLVAAAGGGREVLALRHMGYDADGFECHPGFVAFANVLMAEEGMKPNMMLAPRDSCPAIDRVYDGLIVGWGGYMSIQGRRRRVEFLRNMRTLAKPGAPILVSFFVQVGADTRYLIAARIGNVFRWFMRRERLEVGDWLVDNYVHVFTKERIAAELEEAGFDMVYFGTKTYGHAVGIASHAESFPRLRSRQDALDDLSDPLPALTR